MDTIDLCQSLIADTIDRYPVVWARGAGSRLYDAGGKEYIDFFTGHGVLALGYGHPEQQAAMQAQLARLVHTGNHFHLEVQGRLAAALCGASFADKVFYANSGAESVELAIKLARRYKRRHDRNASAEILCMAGSFHGRSYGALSATGQEKYKKAMDPMLPGIGHVSFNDAAALEAAVSYTTAAVLLEPVQGDGGVIPATPEFLQAARALCDRYGALLIFDEIQTGLGRCGETFAYQECGIVPDVLLLGKPLGGGLPLSALLTTEKVAAVLGHGDHGSTFGGNPVAAAGGQVLLEALGKPGLLENVRERGALLREELEKLRAAPPRLVKEIRGRGLLLGMELSGDARGVCERALAAGLVINNPVGNVLRFLPALTIPEEDIREGCRRLGRVLL